MEPEIRAGFDAEFEAASRAVDQGWLTREDVEAAVLKSQGSPSPGLLAHLPLTPDQRRQLAIPAAGLPVELQGPSKDPARWVSQYVLAEHRRSGGMGSVVKAWDTRLSRWVALKFMKRLGDASLQSRFQEEARLAAGLAHPNIAAIHEIGEHSGAPFIAMQFIDGRSLAEARRTLKPREAARIVRDAARAVAFAHERGIIHRDLKPSNVMLDASGRAYVTDFGLAARLESSGAAGSINGTPAYISPEQAREDAADERSDVFGLGGILYELLAGSPPNAGRGAREILRNARNGQGRIPPRTLNRRVEPDLETIVLKCLDQDPRRRYASAGEVADDLDRFLIRDPIAARRPSFVYRFRMRFAKRKMAVVAGLSVILLAGGLSWWFLVGSPATEHTRLYADAMNLWVEVMRSSGPGLEHKDCSSRARKARAGFERAIEARDAAPAQLMRARCFQVEGKLDEALNALVRAVELDPTHGGVRIESAKLLLWRYKEARGLPSIGTSHRVRAASPDVYLGELPAETPEQRRWRERGEEHLSAGSPEPAQESLLKGLLHMGRGEFPEAARAFSAYSRVERWDPAAFMLEGICRFYARDYAAAVTALDQYLSRVPDPNGWLWRGHAQEARGSIDEAIADYSQAIERHPRASRLWLHRGQAQHSKGLVEKAVEDYSKALELEPDNFLALSNRGNARVRLGLHDEAIADHSRTIELMPRNSNGYNRRGIAKRAKGMLDEAIEDYTKAIEMEPKYAAVPFFNRGNAKGDKGQLEEAIADYTRSLEADPDFTLPFFNRGNAWAALRRHDLAVLDFTKAIEAEPNYAEAYINRGLAIMRLGRLEEAFADFEKSIEMNPNLPQAYVNRGAVLLLRGLVKEALKDIEKAISLDAKHAPAYHARACVKRDQGRFDEALADYDTAIELSPRYGAAYLSRGALLNDNKGLPDQALRDFDKVIELDPRSSNGFCNRGAAKVKKGLLDEAIIDLTRAIELDPGSDMAHRNRGEAKSQKGMHDEAIKDFDRAVELSPKNPDHYLVRAYGKIRKGACGDAVEDCDKALALNPGNARSYNIRGIANKTRLAYDDAIIDYTNAIRLSPNDPNPYGNRGIARAEKGQFDEAMEDYRKALELARPDWSYRRAIQQRLNDIEPERLFHHARKLHQEKKYRPAIEKFMALLESHPRARQAPASAYNIACAYALLGENTASLDWLEKAVEMGWTSVEQLEKDADLESLRREERYRKVVARLKAE